MSHVIDALIAVFVMVLVMLFGVSIINAQVSTSNARSYKNDIVAELENSNYNPNVINACVEKAQVNGYEVVITLFSEDAAEIPVSGSVTKEDTEDAVAADVGLAYQYKLTFFGESKIHYVRGFAR